MYRLTLLVTLWLKWIASTTLATVEHPQLKFIQIAEASNPVHITNAGDGSGRLFIVSKSGLVFIHKNGALLPTPFLDISGLISTNNERGLLSIAFPPGYSTKRHFFAAYSRSSDGALVLSRFTVPFNKPDVASTEFEQKLLEIPHPSSYHYGGQLAFGPDGYLYFSVGDGEQSQKAQSLDSPLGKILRIDTGSFGTSYSAPSNNPYVGVAGAIPQIWATGLRNPWRFSFDRQTGDLYIADVGQRSREEINYLPATNNGGQNFGWPDLEGTQPYNNPPSYDPSSFTPPAIEYDHSSGRSVTGGFVYRGPASRLTGLYIYADYIYGKFWGASQQAGQWTNQLLEDTEMKVSSFGESQSGGLYVADYEAGRVFEIIEDTQVRHPLPSPPAGTYPNAQLISVETTTPGSVVHFTIDGTEPTESDSVIPQEGLTVEADSTLKFKAFHPDLQPSPTTTSAYQFQVGTPTFSPPGGIIDPDYGIDVTLETVTESATIHFTLDGSLPDETSPVYSGPIHLASGIASIHAVAYREGYAESSVAAEYWGAPLILKPTISIANNLVTITGEETLRYTLDGSEPTALSIEYTGPFEIIGPSTLRVKSFRFGHIGLEESRELSRLSLERTGGTPTVAGTGTAGFLDSENPRQAQFRSPEGICLTPAGDLIIADTGNHAIRKSTPYQAVGTLAGNGTSGYVDGSLTNARFKSPRGVCADPSGNIYVTDDGNHVIRKITPAGLVSTYAGSGVAGTNDGPGPQASFSDMQGITIDGEGNLYVGGLGIIRKIDSNQVVTTLAALPSAARVSTTITPDGRHFAVGSSTKIHEFFADGQLKDFSGNVGGSSDGDRKVARYWLAQAITSDSLGTLYVCDGNRVRMIRQDGTVSTAVNCDSYSTSGNLLNPKGIAAGPNATIWVAETGRHLIRRFIPADWEGDGIWDDREGGDTPFVVGIDDRIADSDNDGQSNSTEYITGSDPLDPSSRFEILSVTPGSDHSAQIRWKSKLGTFYEVYYSSDLLTWKLAEPGRNGSGGIMESNHTSDSSGRVFYQVRAK